MSSQKLLTEADLAALAKRFRTEAKKNRPQAAKELGVSHTTVFNAEESLNESLLKARMRMIEAYSPFTVDGPFYVLRRKMRVRRSTGRN